MTTTDDFFTYLVLSELDRIRFTEAPIEVSDEARHFVRELAKAVSTSTHPLLKFVMSKKTDELRDAAIRLMLNSDAFALFAECSSLAEQKEKAIAVQDFELAAILRDQQYAMRAKLGQQMPTPILILPVHVARLFRDLGFELSCEV